MPSYAKLSPMNVLAHKPWTQAEFFAWAEHQEGRFEFDGFQPVAMTGGNARHDRITGNIHTALRSRLRGKPCSNFGPNLGVETTASRIRYPDALITCTKFPDSERIAPNVVVIFEVLSPSSSGTDRIEKVREYQAVSTILRYVIVESATPGLQVLHRTDGTSPWTAHALTKDDVLSVPEAQIEIPVAEFYEDIEFEGSAPGNPSG
jgi:Uma2 family endonuclease